MGVKSCADARSAELWGNEVSCEKDLWQASMTTFCMCAIGTLNGEIL